MPTDTKRNANIISRVKAGETYQAIADDYGICRERVRQIAKRAGMPSRQQYIGVSDALRRQWADAYKRGLPPAHIERGPHGYSVVHRTLVSMGVHTPERGPKARSEADKDFVRRHYHKRRVSEIALALGTTRNAVIGLARRLGLSKPKALAHAA